MYACMYGCSLMFECWLQGELQGPAPSCLHLGLTTKTPLPRCCVHRAARRTDRVPGEARYVRHQQADTKPPDVALIPCEVGAWMYALWHAARTSGPRHKSCVCSLGRLVRKPWLAGGVCFWFPFWQKMYQKNLVKSPPKHAPQNSLPCGEY